MEPEGAERSGSAGARNGVGCRANTCCARSAATASSTAEPVYESEASTLVSGARCHTRRSPNCSWRSRRAPSLRRICPRQIEGRGQRPSSLLPGHCGCNARDQCERDAPCRDDARDLVVQRRLAFTQAFEILVRGTRTCRSFLCEILSLAGADEGRCEENQSDE